MAERKMKHPITGEMHDVEIVDIEEINEKPMKVKLADGTLLRIKVDVVEVSKFKGERGPDGHPIYNVRSGTIITVMESKEHP